MGQFQYIVRDFRDMSEDERKQVQICQGPINIVRLYKYIHGQKPTSEQITEFQSKYKIASRGFTRCQLDLIHAEFGTDIVTFDQAKLLADNLTKEPLDANVKKLIEAIKEIERVSN